MKYPFGSMLVWGVAIALGGCGEHLEDWLGLPEPPSVGGGGAPAAGGSDGAGEAGAGGAPSDPGEAGAGGAEPVDLPGDPLGADAGAAPSEPPLVTDAGPPPEPPAEPPMEEPPMEEPPMEPPMEEPPAEPPMEPPMEPPAEPPVEPPAEPPVIEPPAEADAGAPDAAPTEPAPPPAPSFAADVWPIFVSGCTPCHTGAGFGGHNVGSPDLAAAFADAVRLGPTLIARLDGGGMPLGCAGSPGDPGCIAVDDLATIQSWIDGGLAP